MPPHVTPPLAATRVAATDQPTRQLVMLHGIYGRGRNWQAIAKGIVAAAPDRLPVIVSVAGNATVGRRSVFLNGATGDASVAVYSTIDFIKVLPQAGMARVGG